MDENSALTSEKIVTFLKSNILILAIGLVGLIFMGIGFFQMIGSKPSSIEFESVNSKDQQSAEIAVNISGAVINPGVYSLKNDLRIQDALIAAGGLSQEADREYINKYVNLAQKMTDGMKLYIPKTSDNKTQAIAGANSMGKISINSASEKELESLPGVGPVTASKIVNARPYSQIEELLDKKVVGKATFEKIKDLVQL